MRIDAALAAAKAAHQAGRLTAAKAGYLKLLSANPNHIETLYLLGALYVQEKQWVDAVSRLRACLRVSPAHVFALEALAVALSSSGDKRAAVIAWNNLVAAQPGSAAALHKLGVACREAGDMDGAVAALGKAVAIDFQNAGTAADLATTLRIAGRLAEADPAYRWAIALAPDLVGLRDEFAGVLFDLGRFDEAEAMVRSAIAIDADAPNPHTNLGRMLVRKPGGAREALQHHDACLIRRPDDAEAHSNRSAALYVLGRLEEAERACLTALKLKPGLAEAHANLGNIHYRRGDMGDAILSYNEALRRNPALPEADWNRGLALLTIGEFAKGWPAYEARWRCRDFLSPDRSLGLPRLTSLQATPGPIMVWGEQGIGDEIVYGSMIPELAARGFEVVLECDPRLAPIWRRSCPTFAVVDRGAEAAGLMRLKNFRWQIPVGSLGSLLRPSAAAFPAETKFLSADDARRTRFRQELGSGTSAIVGISWLSKNHDAGAGKSIPLIAWAGLLGVPDVTFVSLQYGDAVAEIGELAATSDVNLRTIEGLDLTNDLDGAASLIAACDLVVTVSNVTAHLAGALDRPVLVLAPSGAGRFWYWQSDQPHTPVYRSAQIFRQSRNGSWTDALAGARQAVMKLIATRPNDSRTP